MVFASSMAGVGTWFGLHFHSTHPANNWTVNQSGLSSICMASYAHPPLVKLYFLISYTASFLSWSFPTKCVMGSAPVLLNPMIRWIISIVMLTLWSSHKCPPCTQDNKTFTTALILLLRLEWGIYSKFNSLDGCSEAIQAYGVSASIFVVRFTAIAMD